MRNVSDDQILEGLNKVEQIIQYVKHGTPMDDL